MALAEFRSSSRSQQPLRIPTLRLRTTARCLVAVLAAGSVMLSVPAGGQKQSGLRTITGTVTDGHEPLSGAVVQLQNPGNNSIVSYITDASGSYHFQRLDGQTDFNVWAMFRGHRSGVHAISKFDSHMDKVINLTVKTY